MRVFLDLPIRLKLQLLTFSIAAVSLLFASGTFMLYDLQTTRLRIAQRLLNEATIVGSNSSAALVFNDPQVARKNLVALKSEPHVESAVLHTAGGRVFVRYDRDGDAASRLPPPPLAQDGWQFGEDGLLVSSAVMLDGKRIGTISIRSELAEIPERMARFAGILVLTLLASSALALFLSSRLQRVISGPILTLASAARAVSGESDYSVRVEKLADDEVGQLFDGFNDMLAQIQRRDNELEEHRAHLEDQVRVRTVDLSRANEALEREIAEHRLAREAIAATNRDLETLLHVTSHDLREPLRAIENFSHLVSTRCAASLDAKGQDFLRRIENGAARMSALLEDILTLSRAQRTEMALEEVDLDSIVSEVQSRLEVKIRETGARVSVAPGLPRVRANRTWATQAVYNLVVNALKFTRDGEAAEVEIAGCNEAGQSGLVVSDRGPGVEPRHAERIFQLFQRAVGREVEGTGAGLAIVRQVAERHGGTAWVRPRQGGGSEFIVTFGEGRSTEEE